MPVKMNRQTTRRKGSAPIRTRMLFSLLTHMGMAEEDIITSSFHITENFKDFDMYSKYMNEVILNDKINLAEFAKKHSIVQASLRKLVDMAEKNTKRFAISIIRDGIRNSALNTAKLPKRPWDIAAELIGDYLDFEILIEDVMEYANPVTYTNVFPTFDDIGYHSDDVTFENHVARKLLAITEELSKDYKEEEETVRYTGVTKWFEENRHHMNMPEVLSIRKHQRLMLELSGEENFDTLNMKILESKISRGVTKYDPVMMFDFMKEKNLRIFIYTVTSEKKSIGFVVSIDSLYEINRPELTYLESDQYSFSQNHALTRINRIVHPSEVCHFPDYAINRRQFTVFIPISNISKWHFSANDDKLELLIKTVLNNPKYSY